MSIIAVHGACFNSPPMEYLLSLENEVGHEIYSLYYVAMILEYRSHKLKRKKKQTRRSGLYFFAREAIKANS